MSIESLVDFLAEFNSKLTFSFSVSKRLMPSALVGFGNNKVYLRVGCETNLVW